MSDSPTNSEHATSSDDVDVPVVVRSDPFSDLRPFIEHLWMSRTDMCVGIYTDQFPRGKNGKATKEEEDEFLLSYFSLLDFKTLGGRFLKQALYSIAKYNDDTVLEFVARWTSNNRDYYENPGLLMGMCGDVAEPKKFFDVDESAGHSEAFLQRAVNAIRHGLRELEAAQRKEKANGGPSHDHSHSRASTVHTRGHSTDTLSPPSQNVPKPMAPASKGKDVKEKSCASPVAEPVRMVNSTNTSQPPSTRFAPRQPHKPNQTQFRRMSGNMYASPQPTVPFPAFTQDMAAPTGPRAAFPDFDPSISFVPDQSSYLQVGQPLIADPRFVPSNFQTPSEQQGHPSYGMMSRQSSISYLDPPTQPRSNTATHSWYDEASRTIQHRSNGSIGSRGARGSFSHQSRPLDPNSFSRFPGNKFAPRPYPSRSGRRASMHSSANLRRPSIRSHDSWQAPRSRTYDTPPGRVVPDHMPLIPSTALQRKLQTPDSISSVDGIERGHQRHNQQAHSHGPSPSGPIPDEDPRWGCTEVHVGTHRIDILGLVASGIPLYLKDDEVERYLVKEIRCFRVASPPGPPPNSKHPILDRIIFVNFHSATETRGALGRTDLVLDGIGITFKVPWKFWKKGHPDYLSPSQAKAAIESGLIPLGNRRGHSFTSNVRPHALDSFSAQNRAQPNFNEFGVRQEFYRSKHAANVSIPSDLLTAYDTISTAQASYAVQSIPTLEDVVPTKDHMRNSLLMYEEGQPAKISHPVSEASTPKKKKGKKKSKQNLNDADSGAQARSGHLQSSKCRIADVSPDHRLTATDDAGSKNDDEAPTVTYASVAQATDHAADPDTTPTLSSHSPTVAASSAALSLPVRSPGSPLPQDEQTYEQNISAGACAPNEFAGEREADVLDDKDSGAEDADNVSQEPRSSSSKAAEDVDESFQTAAETPESVKLTVNDRSADEATETNDVDLCSHTTSEAGATSGIQSPTTPRSPNLEEIVSVPESAEEQPFLRNLTAPDKADTPKSGPKQTESLSPFARQALSKKKDNKSKPVKGKTRNKAVIAHPDQESHTPSDGGVQSDANPEHTVSIRALTQTNATQTSGAQRLNETLRKNEQSSTTPLGPFQSFWSGAVSSIKAVTTKVDTAKVEVNSSKETAPREIVANVVEDRPSTTCITPIEETAAEEATDLSEIAQETSTLTTEEPRVHPEASISSTTADPVASKGQKISLPRVQPTAQGLVTGKKQKKKKNKKSKASKAGKQVMVRDDDASSTGTLAYETSTSMATRPGTSGLEIFTAGSTQQSENIHQKGSASRKIFGNITDNSLPGTVSQFTFGSSFNADNANLAIRTNDQVEQSRIKLREMERQEKMLKLKHKKTND